MPLEPVPEQILAAMVSRLQAITAGATYHYTPRYVERIERFLDEVNELPGFLVLPSADEGDATPLELGDGDGTDPGGLISAALGVEVVAYGQGSDTEPVARVLFRLLRDAEIALCGPDLHLGLGTNVVLDILNTRRVTVLDVATGQAEGWRGAMSHLYRVRFDYQRGLP